jgi:hypothetical protein
VGWLKFLKNIGNAESTRESIRLSYKKHSAGAAAAEHDTDRHSVGLYGALATRYRLMRRRVVEVEVWAELAPFLAMSVGRGVEALAEYIVYQERPNEARTSWLKKEINNALMLRGAHLQFAVIAIANQVLWAHWLDAGTKRNIDTAGTEMEREPRGASMPALNTTKGPRSRPGVHTSAQPQPRSEPAIKYNLDKLRCGISAEKAIELLIGACNKPDTMFVTERWIKPRLGELSAHLSNPITTDQAQALQDVVLQRCPFKDVLGWLRSEGISWKDYQVRNQMFEADAERARVKEVRKRWENRDLEAISRLQAAGVRVYIPPEVAFRHKEEEDLAVDEEASEPLRKDPDPTDRKA